jgi:hypothetical protein
MKPMTENDAEDEERTVSNRPEIERFYDREEENETLVGRINA